MDKCFDGVLGDELKSFVDDLVTDIKVEDHLSLLEKYFERCERYCIALNAQKCVFDVTHRTLLGHVISEHGLSTDPKKVKKISELNPPCNLKQL